MGKARKSVREKMSQLDEMLELQKIMAKHNLTILEEVKDIRKDIGKLRQAVLYVFEMITGYSASAAAERSARLDGYVKSGINALAEHNKTEAIRYLAKIKTSSSE